MATISGTDGVVKVSTNTVLSVTNFTININAGTVEDTAMGDGWRTYITEGSESKGLKLWDASIECRYDGADTTGQEALVEGAEVAVSLLVDGTNGKAGTCIVTSVSVGASFDDSAVSRSITVVGNGALADTP